ncbi:hypothetical protein HK097_011655, partial [Rhizophlyctis rosea]
MNAGTGGLPSASALLGSADQLQSDLRKLLKNPNVDPFSREVSNLRQQLRDTYEQIIFSDIDLALSKDVEANVWKIAHYRFIEEFRKKVKTISNNAKQRGGSSRALSQEERQQMRILTASFRSFLTEANGFYLSFIQKMTHRFDLERVERIVLQKLDVVFSTGARRGETIGPAMQTKALMVCHRALIFLGDLSRYREIHADKKEKNWALAKSFYELALRLVPTNGNPFNQLAVIDTYEGDELGAVECYFRSLVIQQPFPTAMENLALLFRKARGKAEGGKEAEPARTDAYSDFVKEFIVLHSYVFGKDVSLDRFSSAKSAFLGKFMDLLKSQQFPPELLTRLFIINFGAAHLIHTAVAAAEKGQDDSSNEEGRLHGSVVQKVEDNNTPESGQKRRMVPQKANARTKTSAKVLASRQASVPKIKEDLTLEQKKEIGKNLVLLSIDMACPVFTAVAELAQHNRIDGMDEGSAFAKMLVVVKIIGRWLLERAREGQEE